MSCLISLVLWKLISSSSCSRMVGVLRSDEEVAVAKAMS